MTPGRSACFGRQKKLLGFGSNGLTTAVGVGQQCPPFVVHVPMRQYDEKYDYGGCFDFCLRSIHCMRCMRG